MEDLYQILGVSRDAGDDEIKKAYRKLAQKYHPDKGGSKDDEAKFKKISAAYEVLGDKERRRQYDQFGSTGGPGGFDFSQFQNMNFEFGGQNFGDIFDAFFGGGMGRGQKKRGPARGSDIEMVIGINFEEAIFGATKEIEVTSYDACERCKGEGAEPGSKLINCKTCDGTGQEVRIQRTILGQIQTASICHACHGNGRTPEKKCKDCGGEGRVLKNRTIKVKIPAGIHDKAVLRLSGKGEAGGMGGSAGDLFVHVSVSPSKEFERVGDDIHTEQKIHLLQAVLGDQIQVKTVHGDVDLNIPAGTDSGKTFKISEHGAPKVGTTHKGDHVVKIIVETPKRLSKKEKELYEALAKEEGLDLKAPKGLFG